MAGAQLLSFQNGVQGGVQRCCRHTGGTVSMHTGLLN